MEAETRRELGCGRVRRVEIGVGHPHLCCRGEGSMGFWGLGPPLRWGPKKRSRLAGHT